MSDRRAKNENMKQPEDEEDLNSNQEINEKSPNKNLNPSRSFLSTTTEKKTINQPVVRKLSEARKMPFLKDKRDESLACCSSKITDSTESKASSQTNAPPKKTWNTSPSYLGFASATRSFNFNTIKNRFNSEAGNTTEIINKTNKRQFERINNDFSSLNEEKTDQIMIDNYKKSSEKALSVIENLNESESNDSDDQILLQSESKRQKSDLNHDTKESSSLEKGIKNSLQFV